MRKDWCSQHKGFVPTTDMVRGGRRCKQCNQLNARIQYARIKLNPHSPAAISLRYHVGKRTRKGTTGELGHCYSCGKDLPIEQMTGRRITGRCKACGAAYQRAYHFHNQVKMT